MYNTDTNVDRLLKARTEIDEELRRLKSSLTILFTDVVGSTAYFDRYGDTAGISMLHRHADLVTTSVEQHSGRVIKTIGDSVMAEFPNPRLAVQVAIAVQRRQQEFNRVLPENERVQMRIGINSGMGYRKNEDVYGDVVNLAARLTKRSGPAQILISDTVRQGAGSLGGAEYTHLGKVTVEGRSEKGDIYEVVWTDLESYQELRRASAAAIARGDHAVGGQSVAFPRSGKTNSGNLPGVLFPTPLPAPAALSVRYDLLEEVGQGGMGIVYKARDRETGDLVALKLLKPEVASDQKIMERFKNELRLARIITHKHVCRIHEFNRVEGTACISMEYVEGESLRASLNRFGSMGVQKAAHLGLQICSGLQEAHARGVIHRDLKPENIMVDSDGNVKIMDFGIARSVYKTTTTTGAGSPIGTPAYMAPEQAECRYVDARTDIYALGLILYEVLTGTQTFRGDTAAQMAYKQVHEVPRRLREITPSLSPAVEAVVLRCLAKDPSQRFQTCEELGAALIPLTATEGMVQDTPKAVSPVPSQTVTLRLKSGRRIQPTTVAAMLLLLGATGWGLWHLVQPAEFFGSERKLSQILQEPAPVHATTPPVQANTPAAKSEVRSEMNSGKAMKVPSAATRAALTNSPPPRAKPLEKKSPSRSKIPVSIGIIPPPAVKIQNQSPARVEAEKTAVLREVPERPEEASSQEKIPGNEIKTSSEGQNRNRVAPPSATGRIFLQVKIFARLQAARSLQEELTEADFPVQLLSPADKSGYRVRVGPFETLALARAAQRCLTARGYKTVLQIGEM